MTPDRRAGREENTDAGDGTDGQVTDGGSEAGGSPTASGQSGSRGSAEPELTADRERQTGRPEQVASAEEIDWRGWLLVGLVFVCFLVIPAMVLYLPQAQGFLGSLGLSLRQAYLALPMIPAIVLGVVAVWAALRTQARE
ncbi:MAG: hypothetical protein ACOCPZ_02445 [Natrialbaceae archaeon]